MDAMGGEAACPDADDIAAFVGGGLTGTALANLEAHLDRCAICAQLAADAARLTDDDPPSSDDALPVVAPADLDAGTAIGRYIVLGRIGSGGMGEVCVAYDRELDRKVALKLLRPSLDVDAAARRGLEARLQREARAMAKLHHPNVVPVHDIGEWQSRVFIAMEYIEGGTLRSWLHERTRSWREIRAMFVTTARALAAAHEVGLVHCDFKPTNVLVDRSGRPFVADFGLATSRDHEDGSHEMGGTPAYMAPEQRSHAPVDARADQYALCVALFEALHGRRPSETDESATGPFPNWLAATLRRGLQRDPARRFSDMAALIDALDQDRRIHRRRRTTAAIAAGIFAAVGIAGLVLSRRPTAEDVARVEELATAARVEADAGRFVYPPADDPDHPTAYANVMQLEALTGPAGGLGRERAAHLRDEFATHLVARADELWSDPNTEVFAIDLYAAALVFDPANRAARERAALTPGQVAGLRRQAAELDFTAGELAAATDFAALARADDPGLARTTDEGRPAAIAKRIANVPRHPPATAPQVTVAPTEETAPRTSAPVRTKPESTADPEAELSAALASLRAADLSLAERGFRRVLKDRPRSHRATAGLGEVEFERGAYAQALTHFEHAVALAPKRADYRVLLGDALLKVQRWYDARRQYERAAALGSGVARKRLQQLDASVR